MSCQREDIELHNVIVNMNDDGTINAALPRKRNRVTISEDHCCNEEGASGKTSSEDCLNVPTNCYETAGRGQFARAVCTLLPSRHKSGRQNAYCVLPAALAHTVTLPRHRLEMIQQSPDPDQVVICLRRQLSSASHNIRWSKDPNGPRTRRTSLHRTTSRRDARDHVSEAGSFVSGSDDSEEGFSGRLAAIRDMPLPLEMKKQYRNKLIQGHEKPSSGLAALDLKQHQARQHLSDTAKEVLAHLGIWAQSLKKIEGYYGTGVVSYFLFLRWLIFMNTAITAIMLTFVILPQMLSVSKTVVDDNTFQVSRDVNVSLCFKNYTEEVERNSDHFVGDNVLDFLQGTGWLELTYAFIGKYQAENRFESSVFWDKYNPPLAYLFTTLGCFFLCLILMVNYTAEGFRETLMNRGNFHQYCNMVFSGWDYCIEREKTAQLKHASIAQELKSHLAEERRKAEVASWSRAKKASVFTIRMAVNLVVLAILAGSLVLIFYVASFSVSHSTEENKKSTDGFKGLLIEFLPSITISGLNFVVPFLYNIMIGFENYSTDVKIKVSLARTVLLRMASILVLLMSFYFKLTSDTTKKIKCWETYVGQQIYKLAIFDFLIVVGTTFLVELPRMLIVKHWVNKVTQLIGFQEFDISNNVLHIVNSQAICWLGMFYCPFLPCLCMLKYIIFFYLRKFSLLKNCRPSENAYRASRSNAIFMLVLMFAFLVSVIPFGLSIGMLSTSKCCGPFRYSDLMWDVVTAEVEHWPKAIKTMSNLIFSTGFGVIAFVGLSLMIYYYSTVSSAREERIRVLREQLILEGKDKQFLLQRVTERQTIKAIT